MNFIFLFTTNFLSFFLLCNPVRLISNMPATLESSMQEELEEEEVWLYWIDSNKEPHGKSIRHLAQDAKANHKKDVENITYYRLGHFIVSFPL